MTRGRPWDINEIRRLRELFEEGRAIAEISQIMVKTEDAVRQKMYDLKLKEEEHGSRRKSCPSSKLDLPSDMPTGEETILILAVALRKSVEAGLSKDEIQRLQVAATLAKPTRMFLPTILDYRGLEDRLVELERKYDALTKRSKKNAPS